MMNEKREKTGLNDLAGWSKLTSFQQAVLKAVYSIPRGEARTYKQVAQMVAKRAGVKRYAQAYRAVGSVMRKNPYAPLVPCHRVVKSDGTIGNYSAKGGIRAKQLLLKREGASLSREGASLSCRFALD